MGYKPPAIARVLSRLQLIMCYCALASQCPQSDSDVTLGVPGLHYIPETLHEGQEAEQEGEEVAGRCQAAALQL